MSKDVTKCWNCGREHMTLVPELGKDWWQCYYCGATEEANPTVIGVEQLFVEQMAHSSHETKHRPRKRRLSKKSVKA